jgi:hypothetical protein
VAAGAFGDLGSRQHPSDLFDAATPVEALDSDLSTTRDCVFAHQEMRIRESRDLRLMSHA